MNNPYLRVVASLSLSDLSLKVQETFDAAHSECSPLYQKEGIYEIGFVSLSPSGGSPKYPVFYNPHTHRIHTIAFGNDLSEDFLRDRLKDYLETHFMSSQSIRAERKINRYGRHKRRKVDNYEKYLEFLANEDFLEE